MFIPLWILALLGCQADQPTSKVYMLWVDGTANFEGLNHADSIRQVLDRCVTAGITDVIVDVKPNVGMVLYQSDTVPMLTEWKGIRRDPAFDYLGIFIREGHARGLKIHAAVNVFSEGSGVIEQGLVYTTHPEWQTILYLPEGFFPITEVSKKMSKFVNPILPEVIEYELSLIKELVSKYPELDGVVLDRGRFDSISSDFSDASRQAFEAFLGKRLENWPEDIFRWELKGEDYIIVRGPYFKDWNYWRASIIKDFFRQARQVIKDANPDVLFGDYAGSWFPTYYEVGVNWASEKYYPRYDWAREDYYKTGYAELLDFFCSGYYFQEVTKAELAALKDDISPQRWEAAMGEGNEYWYSVEGAAEMSMKVVKGVTPVYGSLYLQQYKEDSQQFIKAMKMVLAKTDGLMLFDLVYVEQYGWWDVIQTTLTGAGEAYLRE